MRLLQADVGSAQARGERTGTGASVPAVGVVRPPLTRILVVDGNASRCAGIASLIEGISPFDTRLAQVAEIALAIANDFLPAIILINTDLPHLAGYRLASVLHLRPFRSQARLIAFTAEIAAADRRRALAAGFEQYLSLPVERAALERVLTPVRTHGRSGKPHH